MPQMQLRVIRERIELYRETRSRLPRTLDELTQVSALPDMRKDGSVLDWWGRPYEFFLDSGTRDGYVLLSRGADPNDPSDDLRSDRLDFR